MAPGLSLEQIAGVMDSANEQELHERLKHSVELLGFAHFTLGVEVCRPLLKAVQYAVARRPRPHRAEAVERGLHALAPVTIQCQLHEPSNGIKSMFSLERDESVAKSPGELEQMLVGARVLANCAHFAISRTIVPALLAAHDPRLTARERECLSWAAKGKTSAEIGMILYISETTVIFHLKNVIRKLDVANRTQAIAVGVSLNLVH